MAESTARAETGTEATARPVVVKKYANRRLYNTEASSYVTLEDLATMVRQGRDFVVYDAKTGEDITRSVLTQIIVEEEAKGQNLLPNNFLRQLISYYGDSLQFLVPRYLEHSMESFARNQEQMRDYFSNTIGGIFPFGTTFEEMGKQNLAMFERAMRMFTPFGPQGEPGKSAPGEQPADATMQRSRAENEKTLTDLQKQLEELQKQLVTITKPKSE
jgi:polyhydroxyalkanoate synthesis repressor PhaR